MSNRLTHPAIILVSAFQTGNLHMTCFGFVICLAELVLIELMLGLSCFRSKKMRPSLLFGSNLFILVTKASGILKIT